jgi:hypothetical protein
MQSEYQFVSAQSPSSEEPGNAEPGSLADLRSTASDVARYHRSILIRCAATFSAMVLCHYGYLPILLLLIANLVLYPEIYLRIHDIGHGTSERRFGWAARFVPVSNPIWGGTRVFATIHREHHKSLGTDQDPWLPYYTGHPLRALFFNFIEPEYSFRAFVRQEGVDRELVLNVLYNGLGLVVGLAVFQWTFVIHLLSQRVVHAVGIFFFNFYTHRESLSARAPIGTWERADELRSVLPLLRLLWGKDTIDGLVFHNRHHCIGQQHVPVQNYKRLVDTGVYTRFHESWPITAIKKL